MAEGGSSNASEDEKPAADDETLKHEDSAKDTGETSDSRDESSTAPGKNGTAHSGDEGEGSSSKVNHSEKTDGETDGKQSAPSKSGTSKGSDDSDEDKPLSKSKPSKQSHKSSALNDKSETDKAAAPAAPTAADSDDEPISKNSKKKPASDSDDEPIAKAKPPAQKASSQKPSVPQDDSDDDKPIKPKASPVTPKKSAKKKRKESSDEDEEDDDDDDDFDSGSRSASKRAKSTTSSQSSAKPSAGQKLKDWLIERYLVRWWYHEEWPPKQRPHVDVPPGYKEMEHYPMLYINEDTGHVLNKRTPDMMPPCKQKMNKLKENEIRQMVIAAINKQKEVLQEHEPNNQDLVKELNSELKEVKSRKP